MIRKITKNSTLLFLICICIAISFPLISFSTVLPNLPVHVPQTELDDLPFDKKEMIISEQTTLADMKRMFETLEHKSVHAPVSDDSHGPVAWYEPQQDEVLYDDGGKCFLTLKKEVSILSQLTL